VYTQVLYLAAVIPFALMVLLSVRRKARGRSEREEIKRHEETKRMMTRFNELAPYDWSDRVPGPVGTAVERAPIEGPAVPQHP